MDKDHCANALDLEKTCQRFALVDMEDLARDSAEPSAPASAAGSLCRRASTPPAASTARQNRRGVSPGIFAHASATAASSEDGITDAL